MNSVVRLVICFSVCSVSIVHAQTWNPLNAFKKKPAAPAQQSWPGGVGASSNRPVQPVSFIEKWNQGVDKTKQALTIPSFSPPQIRMPQITAPQFQMPQIQIPSMKTQGTVFNLLPSKKPSAGKGISSLIPKWMKPQPAKPQFQQPPTLNQFLSQKRPQ